MNKVIISQFRDKPKLKITWWAMWLGLVTLFGGQILGISAALLVPLITKNTSEKVGSSIGFSVMILTFAVLIITLILSIKAYRHGERSWAMWLGLIPAILGCAFWIFMLAGELLFPH